MKQIKVTVQIKHHINNGKLYQYFNVSSFFDYFMDETFLFYRKLNDFIKSRYLSYPVIETSEGKYQFRLVYDISSVPNPETADIDVLFNFSVPEERNCNFCEYNKEGNCAYLSQPIPEKFEYCSEFYEKNK